MKAGEIVVMLPFVEQGVQKDLGRDHLLAVGGLVINADASGFNRAVGEGAAIVAVRLALQTLPVVRVDLGSISDDEVAMGETRERIELVDQELAESFALASVVRCVDDSKCKPTCDSARLDREPGGTLASPVRGVGASTEHLLREYTTVPAYGAGTEPIPGSGHPGP